jgi:transcriptional regulator with XRE-family HTH domain
MTARMLLDWSQDRLAEAAGVGIATIKRLEAQDNGLGGRDDTVSKIVGALESAGIEFTNGGEPGVRLRDPGAGQERTQLHVSLYPHLFQHGVKWSPKKIPGLFRFPSERQRTLTTYVPRLMCCEFITSRKKCSDPQLAVEETQRNLITAVRVQSFRIISWLLSGIIMSTSSRSETQETFTRDLQNAAALSSAFDRGLAVKIGARVAMRRSLCGLSKLQLAARLGIDSADVSAYEQGEKRMSCKLLLEAAKQLKATPRFFFQ